MLTDFDLITLGLTTGLYLFAFGYGLTVLIIYAIRGDLNND